MTGRPFYPHEADDPDLDWIISNFLYDHPNYIPVEVEMLPLILIPDNTMMKNSKDETSDE